MHDIFLIEGTGNHLPWGRLRWKVSGIASQPGFEEHLL